MSQDHSWKCKYCLCYEGAIKDRDKKIAELEALLVQAKCPNHDSYYFINGNLIKQTHDDDACIWCAEYKAALEGGK